MVPLAELHSCTLFTLIHITLRCSLLFEAFICAECAESRQFEATVDIRLQVQYIGLFWQAQDGAAAVGAKSNALACDEAQFLSHHFISDCSSYSYATAGIFLD